MKRHGYHGTPVYKLWAGIVTRCENPKSHSYKWYGARGISIDKNWRTNPKAFCDWAIENGYKPGLEIDRIDVNGNYTPENCQFVTHKENCAPNKRRTRKTSKTGERNVVPNKCGKYDVYAFLDGKQKYIGSFSTVKDAVNARDKAENNIHDKED